MPKVLTPRCFSCDQKSEVEITQGEYDNYLNKRQHVQVAMPDRDANFRELLISGTHNACWMTMFCDLQESQMDFQNFMWVWCYLTGIAKMGRIT